MQKANLKNIKKLFAELAALKYVKAIYVSGSAARNASVAGSDIDINVLYDNVLYDNANPKLIELLQNSITEAAKIKGYNLHIQPPKAISEFWDLVRSGEPWMMTELESAIVLHDPSELIAPLKALMKKHKLYNKQERAAILIDRAKIHFQNAENMLFSEAVIFLADAAVTSAQAILMYFDRFVPYTELPDAMKRFVREELMSEEEHRFFVLLLKLYNMDQNARRQYCKKHKVTLDHLIDGSVKFLERMEHMFELLEQLRKKEQSIKNYNAAVQLMGGAAGNKRNEGDDEKAILAFESEISKKKHYIPATYVSTLRKIIHMRNLAEQKRFGEIRSEDIHETSASLKYLERLFKAKRS